MSNKARMEYSLTLEAIEEETAAEEKAAQEAAQSEEAIAKAEDEAGSKLLDADVDPAVDEAVLADGEAGGTEAGTTDDEAGDDTSDEEKTEEPEKVIIPDLTNTELEKTAKQVDEAQEQAIENSDEAKKDMNGLTLALESLKAQLSQSVLTQESVNDAQAAVLRVRNTYGMRSPMSGLNLEGISSVEESGQLMMEGMASTLRALWQGLCRFTRMLVGMIKDYIGKMFNRHVFESNRTRSLVRAIEKQRKDLGGNEDYLNRNLVNVDDYVSVPMSARNLTINGKQPGSYDFCFNDIRGIVGIRNKSLEYFTGKDKNSANVIGFLENTQNVASKIIAGQALVAADRYNDASLFFRLNGFRAQLVNNPSGIGNIALITNISTLLGNTLVGVTLPDRASTSPEDSIDLLQLLQCKRLDVPDSGTQPPQYLRYLSTKEIIDGSKSCLFMADTLINDKRGLAILEGFEKCLDKMSKLFTLEVDKLVIDHPERARTLNVLIKSLQNCSNFVNGACTVFPQVAIAAHYAWNNYLTEIFKKEREFLKLEAVKA